MKHPHLHVISLFLALALSSCGGNGDGGEDSPEALTDTTSSALLPCELDDTEQCIHIPLPCARDKFGAIIDAACEPDAIDIPDGRPIYALLVSGYQQNGNFDMFHYYDFAKCILEEGLLHEKNAYVHYAWWNNLLAPYMAKPLHDPSSNPGSPSIVDPDKLGFLPIIGFLDILPDKAIPGEDFQFQADTTAMLTAIRESNPDAVIILVGHSMGGDAVSRFGASTDIKIDLLAPIDPVGNRTCTPWSTLLPDIYQCSGLVQWTRWRATHEDYTDNASTWWWPLDPPRRSFASNINYLYHRWQQEGVPPLDFLLPLPYPLDTEYTYIHPAPRKFSIHDGSPNVQAKVNTTWAFDIPFSGIDGHGEIVGFQGLDLAAGESHPYALRAQNDWPAGRTQTESDSRILELLAWEKNPNHIDVLDHNPTNPELCMVSGDLCEILKTKLDLPPIPVNQAPVADAGPDQIIECSSLSGTGVVLDGSGSIDPDGDPLTYTWSWQEETMTGESIYTELPLGTQLFALTVDDGRGKTDTDIVDVTVEDTTPPALSISLSPDVLWPPNHKLVKITAFIEVSDTCDAEPIVKLVSITSNQPDDGHMKDRKGGDILGAEFGTDDREFLLRAERNDKGSDRIYTVTYEVTDASGNVTTAIAEVTVPHDQGHKGNH